MFTISKDQSINLTRGDAVAIDISASLSEYEEYIFQPGDVVRFRVFEKNRCNQIVLSKEVEVSEETDVVDIQLTGEDTRIGPVIHKPTEYWYEVELNPDTAPQTIIGYDASGPKVFRLYPEGDDTK